MWLLSLLLLLLFRQCIEIVCLHVFARASEASALVTCVLAHHGSAFPVATNTILYPL